MRCNWLIIDLPGLDPNLGRDLDEVGLTETRQLVELSNAQQIALATSLGHHPRHIQKVVAMASLAQLSSVGCDYCGLLLHAGIASVAQLALTPVSQLHRSVLRLHVAVLQRNDLTPTVDRVQRWVTQAKHLAGG
jgi:predicted flap endonuclease-1-like 5' DNA nuclease